MRIWAWSTRRFWPGWIRRRIQAWWYRTHYRVPMGGLDDTMVPDLGRGRFVDVRRRGSLIDIHEHASGKTIRLVPHQPNHGVLVELWQDGRMRWRTTCQFKHFLAMGMGQMEIGDG